MSDEKIDKITAEFFERNVHLMPTYQGWATISSGMRERGLRFNAISSGIRIGLSRLWPAPTGREFYEIRREIKPGEFLDSEQVSSGGQANYLTYSRCCELAGISSTGKFSPDINVSVYSDYHDKFALTHRNDARAMADIGNILNTMRYSPYCSDYVDDRTSTGSGGIMVVSVFSYPVSTGMHSTFENNGSGRVSRSYRASAVCSKLNISSEIDIDGAVDDPFGKFNSMVAQVWSAAIVTSTTRYYNSSIIRGEYYFPYISAGHASMTTRDEYDAGSNGSETYVGAGYSLKNNLLYSITVSALEPVLLNPVWSGTVVSTTYYPDSSNHQALETTTVSSSAVFASAAAGIVSGSNAFVDSNGIVRLPAGGAVTIQFNVTSGYPVFSDIETVSSRETTAGTYRWNTVGGSTMYSAIASGLRPQYRDSAYVIYDLGQQFTVCGSDPELPPENENN